MSDDETPPWHPWCGCYGCRAGERVGKKAAAKEATTDG